MKKPPVQNPKWNHGGYALFHWDARGRQDQAAHNRVRGLQQLDNLEHVGHRRRRGGGPRKSPQQRISDILRMRRLRLNRAKTTTASSLSDSLSESANNVMRGSARGSASRANSNSLMSNSSSDGFCRNNSGVSYQSARSTRSNMTAVSTLSSTGSSTSYSRNRKGKTLFIYFFDRELVLTHVLRERTFILPFLQTILKRIASCCGAFFNYADKKRYLVKKVALEMLTV